MSREEVSRPQGISKISCKNKLPTRKRKSKLSCFLSRTKTTLHGSTKKMIGRLIFFRSSGLAHWAIYRLLNLNTYSVILRVPLVKKTVFRTLLNNKQSVARLDMLRDWREAHGFGTWRWGTSGFDAAVLKHPMTDTNQQACCRKRLMMRLMSRMEGTFPAHRLRVCRLQLRPFRRHIAVYILTVFTCTDDKLIGNMFTGHDFHRNKFIGNQFIGYKFIGVTSSGATSSSTRSSATRLLTMLKRWNSRFWL